MACPIPSREDLIGKRVLTVRRSNDGSKKPNAVVHRGVIRASSHESPLDNDVNVLIEVDGDSEVQFQQWVSVYKEFDAFLIEDKLVFANRKSHLSSKLQPALSFCALADKFGYSTEKSVVLEFLLDKTIVFEKISNLVPVQMDDVSKLNNDVKTLVTTWIDYHLGQTLLLSRPSLTLGYRVHVFNKDYVSQWDSGVIVSADDDTKLLIVQYKNEQRVVNPALIQISGLPVTANVKMLKKALRITGKRQSTENDSQIPKKRMKENGHHELTDHTQPLTSPLVASSNTSFRSRVSSGVSQSCVNSGPQLLPLTSTPASLTHQTVCSDALRLSSGDSQTSHHSASNHTFSQPCSYSSSSCVISGGNDLSSVKIASAVKTSERLGSLLGYRRSLPDVPAPTPTSSLHGDWPVTSDYEAKTAAEKSLQSPVNDALSPNGFQNLDNSAKKGLSFYAGAVRSRTRRESDGSDDSNMQIPVVVHSGPDTRRTWSSPGKSLSQGPSDRRMEIPSHNKGTTKSLSLNSSVSHRSQKTPSGNLIVINLVEEDGNLNLTAQPNQENNKNVEKTRTSALGSVSDVESQVVNNSVQSNHKLVHKNSDLVVVGGEDSCSLQTRSSDCPVIDRADSSSQLSDSSVGKLPESALSANGRDAGVGCAVKDSKTDAFESRVAESNSKDESVLGHSVHPIVNHGAALPAVNRTNQSHISDLTKHLNKAKASEPIEFRVNRSHSEWMKEMKQFVGNRYGIKETDYRKQSVTSAGTHSACVNESTAKTEFDKLDTDRAVLPNSPVSFEKSFTKYLSVAKGSASSTCQNSDVSRKPQGNRPNEVKTGVSSHKKSKTLSKCVIATDENLTATGTVNKATVPGRRESGVKTTAGTGIKTAVPRRKETSAKTTTGTVYKATVPRRKETSAKTTTGTVTTSTVPSRKTSRKMNDSVKKKQKSSGHSNEINDEAHALASVLNFLKKLDNGLVAPKQNKKTIQKPQGKLELKPTEISSQTGLPLHPASYMRPPAIADSQIKMKQFEEQINEKKEFKSPSSVLSKKPLNLSEALTSKLPFIQDDACLNFPNLGSQCRECKSINRHKERNAKILCRFFAFRKLTFTKKGTIAETGFCSPSDADGADLSLWMPLTPITAPQIDTDMAKYIIRNVGSRFCELVEQEKEAMSWSPVYSEVVWKRPVHGIREMCDVCTTTLFNVHWVCSLCGFVVCLDCYRTMTRKCAKCKEDVSCAICDRGCSKWPRCINNAKPLHEPSRLVLTQIIPSDALWTVGRLIHDVRKKWKISSGCPCGESQIDAEDEKLCSKDEQKQAMPEICVSATDLDTKTVEVGENEETKNESDVVDSAKRETLAETKKELSSPCSLREMILQKLNSLTVPQIDKTPAKVEWSLDETMSMIGKSNKLPRWQRTTELLRSHHSAQPDPVCTMRRTSPIPRHVLSVTQAEFSDIPHMWLDDGRLLQLTEPRNHSNIQLFQQQWKNGQPVLVSNCQQYLNTDLWLPESFSKEFGNKENDLVDCSRKVVLVGHKMRRFWDGFERVGARLKDKQGNPMILKLKDWPPTEDFSELLPSRFEDLLQALPLPEYTHRAGVFNLVSRLPEFFVRPDLGPKMYNAYGSALYPQVGSTNLHLDVSDAVNLILYVGIPEDDKENHEAAAIRAMRDAGCCELTMDRILTKGERPGALWHIFDPQDSDRIRDLLHKVADEVGEPVEPHHDPIHDQSWYLDETLRKRLLDEYSVEPYTLVQCMGDAIFIPAGAPHQVRNLHSCIKAAEDFVSPENLSYCFKLTQEFRHLSDTHSNHEDKLQVKNIIYHAVKDAIAVLMQQDS